MPSYDVVYEVANQLPRATRRVKFVVDAATGDAAVTAANALAVQQFEDASRSIVYVGPSTSGPTVDDTDDSARAVRARQPNFRVSVADYGAVADGETNINQAVLDAIADGHRRLWLPAPCLWIPDSNTTPADLDVEGEDWESCIISVANRATDSRIICGPRSRLCNVAFISKWHDDNTNPNGTQKIAPSYLFINNSDSPQNIGSWPYKFLTAISGPQVTGAGDVVHTDTPQIGVQVAGSGSDGFYALSEGAGTSGLRVVTLGTDVVDQPNGIYIRNGENSPDKAQVGLYIREFGDGSLANERQASIAIDRVGSSRSLYINDADQSAGFGDNWISLNASNIAAGDMINIFHTTSSWTGDAIQINSGAGGGSHTGSFLRFQKAGSNIYRVLADGSVIQSTPASANSLAVNSTMSFHLASNTSLVVSVRGTDGTTRTATLTLA